MRYLKQVLDDIRKGQNIDLYFTIAIAIVISILNVFAGSSLQSYIAPLTLAVLALLANAMLVNRHQINTIFQLSLELKDVGIRSAHSKYPENYLDEQFRNAKSGIWILGTWLTNWPPFQSGFIEAVKSGVPIQILLLDPNSIIAKQRSKDLGFEENSFRPVALFDQLKVFFKENNLRDSRIELRFYDRMPPFTLYAVDECLIMGIFWIGVGRGSSTGPHFEIYEKSSCFGSYSMETFYNIWNAATSVSLKDAITVSKQS